ncbi:MAG: hypothetical protein V3U06_11490 [Candidatus Binatia bacterium]
MLLAFSTLWIIRGVIGVIVVAAIIGFVLYMNRGLSNADGTANHF